MESGGGGGRNARGGDEVGLVGERRIIVRGNSNVEENWSRWLERVKQEANCYIFSCSLFCLTV